jgi:hypothetical protein
MGENSFELKIFLNFNSEESLLLPFVPRYEGKRQKWWLENSAFVLFCPKVRRERYFYFCKNKSERIRVFRIKILKILQFLVLPSPLMGENSFELKIFLNFNSEESLLLQTQKWWLENSAFVLRYERIRVFRIKILKILQFFRIKILKILQFFRFKIPLVTISPHGWEFIRIDSNRVL